MTLILVLYDRDFLEGFETKVFEYGNKCVKEHFEDISGFLTHKKMKNLERLKSNSRVINATIDLLIYTDTCYKRTRLGVFSVSILISLRFSIILSIAVFIVTTVFV
jgi:hypothetical protein